MDSTANEAQARPTLQPLTPDALDDEELSSYEPEFELAFSQDGICNIAISGPAAANKRAVAEGMARKHSPDTWLYASIPHFNESTSTVSTAAVEDALINQMVCQMDLAHSPKSRFRNLMKRNYAFDAVVGIVFAAFVALTVFLVWIAGLLPSSRPAPALCALAFVGWLACIGLCVFHIVRSNLVGRAASRLRPKAKGTDIELSSGEDDSRIERYMGDLVYVLNTNKYDTVVFEDLDSYRNMPVFERLRALNALANAQRSGKRAPLRFVYLVGDGLFEDPHERTRFFDCIIPVISSVDSSNMLIQLRNGLADAGITVEEDFLCDIASFIDDPSLLRDVVNEAHHYKAELFKHTAQSTGDNERLVALLVLKALFPRDFELLQNGQGYVSALLDSRSAIIDEIRARNDERARNLAQKQADAQQAGDSERANEIQAELGEIDREDLECSRKSLAQLLDDMPNPDAVLDNPPASRNLPREYAETVRTSPYFPFIRFALRGGWIDNSYERYLTNFYAESLGTADRELISAIAQGASVQANQTVGNPFTVVSHLDADQFATESARLFALLSHLLAYGPTGKLQALLAGVGHDGDLEWLLAYTESEQFNGTVFGYMEQFLDRPSARLLADDSIDQARKRAFSHRLLAYGTDLLGNEGLRSAICEFAQGDELFLQVDAVAPLSIAEGLGAMGYRPAKLETRECDRELLQFVYDNDLYQPSAGVVDNIVASLLETERALPGGFLVTRIYSLKGSAVREVVEASIDGFTSSVVEETPVPLIDSTEAIAWLLNCDGLAPKRAIAYLKALSDDISIDRIEPIGNYTYQGILIDRGLVEVTPANILDYFVSSGNIVDEHLAAFLEASPIPERFTMATTEQHLGTEGGFLKAVIECEGLSDEKVEEIAVTYRAQFNHFDIEGISESRMCMLVKRGIIRATADNLVFIRQSCPAAAKHFAQADFPAYIELVLPSEDGQPAECGFVRNEALEVFALSTVTDAGKVKLLEGFTEPLALSASYGNELNAAIAQSNFSVNDLRNVDELYERANRKLRRALAEAVVAHRDELAEQGTLLSMEMVCDIAWRLREDRGAMVRFIASQLEGRDPEPSRLEVRTVFERADLKEYMTLIDGPTAVIPDTPDDDALLAALGTLGMAGKQSGKTDWQGLRRINSKGYTRK